MPLTPKEVGQFLANNFPKGSLISSMESFAKVMEDGPGLRTIIELCEAVRGHDDQYGHRISLNGICKSLIENPNLPPDVLDWVIGKRSSYVIASHEKLKLSKEQVVRILDTYDVTERDLPQVLSTYVDYFTPEEYNHHLRSIVDKRTSPDPYGRTSSRSLFLWSEMSALTISLDKGFEIDPETLRKAWRSHDWEVQRTLSRFPNLPSDIIDTYLGEGDRNGHVDREVEANLIRNPNTPEHHLWSYFNDKERWKGLAQNPNLPKMVFKMLFEQGDEFVLVELLSNPLLDEPKFVNVLMRLLDKNSWAFMSALREGWLKQHAENPWLSSELLIRLYDFALTSKEWRLNSETLGGVALKIANHPNSSRDIRIYIINRANEQQKHGVVMEILKGCRDLEPAVIAHIDGFTVGGGDANFEVRYAIAQHPNTDTGILKNYLKRFKQPSIIREARDNLARREASVA